MGGALKATFFGAVSGAVTAGLGELFSSASVVKALGDAKYLVQEAAHGITQGVLSSVQGNKFGEGASAGFLSSLVATGVGRIAGKSQYRNLLQSFSGSIIGGVGASLAKGNFWRGVQIGYNVSTYNHTMHDEPPPTGFNGESWYDEETGITYTQEGNYLYEMNKDGIVLDEKYISSLEIVKEKSIARTINQSLEVIGGLVDFQEGLLNGIKGSIIERYINILNKVGRIGNWGQATMGVYGVINAYSRAGGNFNYSVQQTLAKTVGGFVGGMYGVKIGASAGFVLGGPVGSAFGAVIGGIFYGYMGEKLGGGAVDIYHTLK